MGSGQALPPRALCACLEAQPCVPPVVGEEAQKAPVCWCLLARSKREVAVSLRWWSRCRTPGGEGRVISLLSSVSAFQRSRCFSPQRLEGQALPCARARLGS